MSSSSYKANQGTRGSETLRDRDFYELFVADYERFRNAGGPTKGAAIKDKRLINRATWRDGDMIRESPNISDFNKKDKNLSWDEVVNDNAKQGIALTKKFLDSPVLQKIISTNYEQILDDVKAVIIMNKTGSDDFRKESYRIKQAANEAKRIITGLAKTHGRGEAGKEKDQEANKR